jgi:hypothetical protein
MFSCFSWRSVLREPQRKAIGSRTASAQYRGGPPARGTVAVYRLMPSRHRLALLWLDWSGARVASVDLTLIGDYDEPRRRVRLRAATTKTRKALWVELDPALADSHVHTRCHVGECDGRRKRYVSDV